MSSNAEKLYKFINNELIPGTKVSKIKFWKGFDKSVHKRREIAMEVANTGRVVDDKPKVLRRLALAPVGYRPAELCANAGGREQKEERQGPHHRPR